VCGECGQRVFTDQYREFHAQTYFHRECYAKQVASLFLSALQPLPIPAPPLLGEGTQDPIVGVCSTPRLAGFGAVVARINTAAVECAAADAAQGMSPVFLHKSPVSSQKRADIGESAESAAAVAAIVTADRHKSPVFAQKRADAAAVTADRTDMVMQSSNAQELDGLTMRASRDKSLLYVSFELCRSLLYVSSDFLGLFCLSRESVGLFCRSLLICVGLFCRFQKMI